jgi:hypothetical protein
VIAFYEFQRTAEAALMEYFLALAWIGWGKPRETSGSCYPGRDSNRIPPEYKSEALLAWANRCSLPSLWC